MKNCKLCREETLSVVNIDLKAVPVCNNCCNRIMLQQAIWLVDNDKTDDKTDASGD